MTKQPPKPIPDPPMLVLARVKRSNIVRWLVSVTLPRGSVRFMSPGGHAWWAPERLVVVKDARNDPEAVKIIEGAKA